MSSEKLNDSPTMYICRRGNREQRLLCADLEAPNTLERFKKILPQQISVVYSDPPWNPGNATYWRTHAGKKKCESYERFLDSWITVVIECINRGASDIFCEQSSNEKHRMMFMNAVSKYGKQWPFILLEEWTVFYGSPGSASVRRPNTLLHFGSKKISTNPEGMAGEPMTIRVCAGIDAPPGSWVIDPCMGKGMTSRMAHYFDWNVVGVELNQKRLAYTVKWLERQGYEIEEKYE